MDRQIIIHNTYIKRDRWRTHKKTQNAEKKQREKKIVIPVPQKKLGRVLLKLKRSSICISSVLSLEM